MTKPTKHVALAGLLLLVAVAVMVVVLSQHYSGEAAEVKCARIQEGMSQEEVAGVLADCTWDGAYTWEESVVCWRAPDGQFITVWFEGTDYDPRYPLRVRQKSASTTSTIPRFGG